MDMRIAGSGNIPPGTYDKVTVRGSGRLYGEITCDAFTASGSVKGESILCTERFKTSGRAAFSGKINAKSVRASGTLACGSDLVAKEEVSVSGTLRVGGNTEAARVHVTGSMQCTGALLAEHVELQADSAMHAHRVRGAQILMKRKRVSIFLKRGVSVTEAIEGDTLILEHVTCPRVTGRAVTIGKGCKIDLVQYSEKIELSPKATVEKIEKI